MFKKMIFIAIGIVAVCSGCAAKAPEEEKPWVKHPNIYQLSEPAAGDQLAVMTTNKGVVKLRFFPESAPKAVENFVTHAENGYYDGIIFHRVVKDFVIQSGDPLGTGMGGESIWGGTFEVEVDPKLHHLNGALCMARGEEYDTNGSQFYIVANSSLSEDDASVVQYIKDNLENPINEAGQTLSDIYAAEELDLYLNDGGVPTLDFQYTVFGQVIEGMDVVFNISNVEIGTDVAEKPSEDVIIEKIEIIKY